MGCIHRILSTTAIDLTMGVADFVASKTYPWTARIVADTQVHVLVGAAPTATEDDYTVIEFQEALISVGAGEEVSVIAPLENGTVWVSEIKMSS